MQNVLERLTLFSVIVTATFACGATPWNLKQLSNPPHVYPAVTFQAPGVRALFFEGLPWRGNPTRVFAWYGVPSNATAARVPAIVLVHGGGGTAFADWVRLWTARGYAAIALDTCGSMPINPDSHQSRRHEFGGPPCWDASFDQIDWAENDQWTYHAIADIVLAHSLLRSFPEVDPKRIGITGISWGGYLSSIAASVDPRFRFAVPVYGCGFLGEDSLWVPTFQKLGREKEKKWLELWDPSVYLSRAKMPFLWVTGTNDIGYPLNSFQQTYRLPQGVRALSVRLRMPHSHEDGWKPEEIFAFANQVVNSGVRLPRVLSQAHDQQRAWMKFKSTSPVVRAELLYTLDNGIWKDRHWLVIPAQIVTSKAMVQATLPAGVRVFFFNLTDARGLVVSSEHQIL